MSGGAGVLFGETVHGEEMRAPFDNRFSFAPTLIPVATRCRCRVVSLVVSWEISSRGAPLSKDRGARGSVFEGCGEVLDIDLGALSRDVENDTVKTDTATFDVQRMAQCRVEGVRRSQAVVFLLFCGLHCFKRGQRRHGIGRVVGLPGDPSYFGA